MNKTSLALLAAIVVLVASWLVFERVRPHPGRYQLYQGEFILYDFRQGSGAKGVAVFRLDTETGVTYRYSAGIFKNGREY